MQLAHQQSILWAAPVPAEPSEEKPILGTGLPAMRFAGATPHLPRSSPWMLPSLPLTQTENGGAGEPLQISPAEAAPVSEPAATLLAFSRVHTRDVQRPAGTWLDAAR